MLLLLQMHFCLICCKNISAGHQVHLSSPTSQAASSFGCIVVSLCVLPVVCWNGSLLGFRPIRATVTRKSQIISPLTSCRLISKGVGRTWQNLICKHRTEATCCHRTVRIQARLSPDGLKTGVEAQVV